MGDEVDVTQEPDRLTRLEAKLDAITGLMAENAVELAKLGERFSTYPSSCPFRETISEGSRVAIDVRALDTRVRELEKAVARAGYIGGGIGGGIAVVIHAVMTVLGLI